MKGHSPIIWSTSASPALPLRVHVLARWLASPSGNRNFGDLKGSNRRYTRHCSQPGHRLHRSFTGGVQSRRFLSVKLKEKGPKSVCVNFIKRDRPSSSYRRVLCRSAQARIFFLNIRNIYKQFENFWQNIIFFFKTLR